MVHFTIMFPLILYTFLQLREIELIFHLLKVIILTIIYVITHEHAITEVNN